MSHEQTLCEYGSSREDALRPLTLLGGHELRLQLLRHSTDMVQSLVRQMQEEDSNAVSMCMQWSTVRLWGVLGGPVDS